MTTQEERNILYKEIEKLHDLILGYETHQNFLKNMLLNMKGNMDTLGEEFSSGLVCGKSIHYLLDAWIEVMLALDLCTNDMRNVFIVEKEIMEMLSIDTEFLKRTYKLLEDDNGKTKD